MLKSLPDKLTASTLVIVVLTLSISAGISAYLLSKNYRESIEQQLQTAATSLLALGISNVQELNDFEQMNVFIEESLRLDRIDKIIRIFDYRKKLIYTTLGVTQDPFPRQLSAPIAAPLFFEWEHAGQRYSGIVVPYKTAQHQYYLQLFIPLEKTTELLSRFWLPFSLLMAGLLLIAILIARGLTQHILQPVKFIATYLKNLEMQPVPAWTTLPLEAEPTYIGPIAQGINGLVAKIQVLIRDFNKMSHSVAHELRTPLTIVQGEAETVLMGENPSKDELVRVLRSSLEEVQRMSDIVTTVLQIGAYNRSEKLVQREVIHLTTWFCEKLPGWEKIIEAPIQYQLETAGKDDFGLIGPKLLLRLLDNLVRNIHEHVPGTPQVSLDVTRQGEQLLIRLMDNGPGLSEVQLEQLNTGAGVEGIGLFLCQQIATLCQYRLKFFHPLTGGLGIEVLV